MKGDLLAESVSAEARFRKTLKLLSLALRESGRVVLRRCINDIDAYHMYRFLCFYDYIIAVSRWRMAGESIM
jgi:hypothetical protein